MQGFLRTMIWILVIFAAICGLLYLTVFDVWRVPSDDPKMTLSLSPNTDAGDVLLILKHGQPTDGQLARCVDPQAPLRFVLARLEGSDGELIDIDDQRIRLDTKQVPMVRGCTSSKMIDPNTGGEIELRCGVEDSGGREHDLSLTADAPEGSTAHSKIGREKGFLVSDNRHWHLDSRDYGEVPLNTCQHVVFRLWGAKGWLDSAHRNTLLW